jgi:hypothetical protein
LKKISLTCQFSRFTRSWIPVPRLIPSRTSFTGMTTWVRRRKNLFKELRGLSFLRKQSLPRTGCGESRSYPLVLINSKGISVIFLVIAMLLMITIGYVFSYLIPSKQKSVVFPIQSTQAFFIAQSGVEFAVRYAQENGVGTLNGTTRTLPPGGNNQFTLTYNGTGTGTLTSNGQVPAGTTKRSIQISNFTSFLAPITISYIASASTPADNGSYNTNPTVVTPPGGILAGDLVLMMAQARASSGTISIQPADTRGQTWTSEPQWNTTTCRIRLFWCRFNGTWGANPLRVTMGSATCNTVVMHVFRPSKANCDWQIDVAQVANSFPAPPAPRTVTIPSITTFTNGALVFAGWASVDDNQWDSLTIGWTTPGLNQYRNQSGSDQSQTHAYRVMATAGATGNVSKREATAGGTGATYDAGAYLIIAFKAILTCP